jgi:predicted tellurium resistance membrane protein TerC
MEWISSPDIWLALLTLTALEIVLGIDNLVFIAILADRLPLAQRKPARRIGLALALVTRLLLLLALTWMMRLTKPLIVVLDHSLSGRDLILIGGGLFLLAKAVWEIHHTLESASEGDKLASGGGAAFGLVVAQIAVLDIVFSLDSVITAVGMSQEIGVMVAAIVLAMIVMLVAAEPVGRFINEHPTLKVLALAFLIMIGTMLVADGLGFHVPKGYIYFSLVFACFVEGLNLLVRRKSSRRPQAPAP